MKEELKALWLNVYGIIEIAIFVFLATTAGVLIAKYVKWLWSVL
jgi:UPF0716 family protein affecting phage T7 exclusion